jgi:hypothetical protein
MRAHANALEVFLAHIDASPAGVQTPTHKDTLERRNYAE